jgi:UDP-perosamine 4-acetyltransferase
MSSSEILLNTIRNVVAIDRATSACTTGLQLGQTVYLSDPAANRTLKLTGFSRPESDGRWTDGTQATIDLKLAPESVEKGCLRLHIMPFVTEDKGQTLRLHCGEGPEQVVEFSPGALAWTTVDLPLAPGDTSVQIQIAVDQTFVPSKLGISQDTRALGVMVQKIELLPCTVPDRVSEQFGEQPGELTRQLSLATEELVPLVLGTTISLASPDAERAVRLIGFSGLEPDGRWTDGGAATVALRLATHTGNGRLRLYFTPFVTPHTGQSIRVKCGDGPELVRSYPPGPLRETMLELPMSQTASDGEISISITIDAPNSPASVGLGADERRLGIQLRRLEFVAGFSRVTGAARWALRPVIGTVRRVLFKPRDFLNRPLVERLAQLDKQMREHDAIWQRAFTDQFNALQTELADLTNEGLIKQRAQVGAVLRAIEDLPNRSEFAAVGTRLVSVEQALVKLEQLITALHEKLDIVANRFFFPVDDNTVLVRSFVGHLYCSRNDHAVLVGLTEGGEFEPGLRRLLERVLEPGMVFLDVGAHLGLHTLAAARRVGKSGRVFSFEPTPVTYELLCRTLKLNALDDRVTAWCAAAGSEDTTKPLHVSTISSHNSLYPLPGVETTVQTEVVQLDSELPSGQRVDVAKIDVEGAELDVLYGMSRIIAENPGILIIAEYGPSHLARTGVAPKDWLSAFSSQKFLGYVIEEPSGNCVPIEQVDLSDVFSVNIAFIRSKSPLHPRIRVSAPVQAPVVVIGAGGHAKVVIELIRAQGRYDVVGCTDREPKQKDVLGAPILGSDDVLPDLHAQGIRHCFIALGDNALRRKVAARVTSLGFELVNAISPNAVVSPTARLGRGVAVMAGAVINADARVGDLAIVNTRAAVDHDCQIGEAAHVAPRAVLAGGVRVGPLAFVGAGATIVPGVSVGESTVIGAGATVISSIGPNIVAVGVPAKPLQRSSNEQQVDHGEQS